MYDINVDHVRRSVEIWMPYESKTDYPTVKKYYLELSKYRDLGYTVTTFLGGEKPIVPTISELLDKQTAKEGA